MSATTTACGSAMPSTKELPLSSTGAGVSIATTASIGCVTLGESVCDTPDGEFSTTSGIGCVTSRKLLFDTPDGGKNGKFPRTGAESQENGNSFS